MQPLKRVHIGDDAHLVDSNFKVIEDAIADLELAGGIVVSAAAPVDADGRPDGTIYIQVA